MDEQKPAGQNDAPVGGEVPRHVRVIEEDTSSGAKRKIAALIICIVIIIVAVAVYFSFGSLHKSTTTLKSTSTSGTSASTTVNATTSVINFPIQITAVNLKWSYSGLTNKTVNGQVQNCNYGTWTTQYGGFTMNTSVIAYYLTVQTTACNLTITKASINTPGFTIVSTNPKLPYALTARSTAQLQIMIRATASFTAGPLSITLYDKGS